MAPPPAGPLIPAPPPEDPGLALDSRWLFLSTNVLHVGEWGSAGLGREVFLLKDCPRSAREDGFLWGHLGEQVHLAGWPACPCGQALASWMQSKL